MSFFIINQFSAIIDNIYRLISGSFWKYCDITAGSLHAKVKALRALRTRFLLSSPAISSLFPLHVAFLTIIFEGTILG